MLSRVGFKLFAMRWVRGYYSPLQELAAAGPVVVNTR